MCVCGTAFEFVGGTAFDCVSGTEFVCVSGTAFNCVCGTAFGCVSGTGFGCVEDLAVELTAFECVGGIAFSTVGDFVLLDVDAEEMAFDEAGEIAFDDVVDGDNFAFDDAKDADVAIDEDGGETASVDDVFDVESIDAGEDGNDSIDDAAGIATDEDASDADEDVAAAAAAPAAAAAAAAAAGFEASLAVDWFQSTGEHPLLLDGGAGTVRVSFSWTPILDVQVPLLTVTIRRLVVRFRYAAVTSTTVDVDLSIISWFSVETFLCRRCTYTVDVSLWLWISLGIEVLPSTRTTGSISVPEFTKRLPTSVTCLRMIVLTGIGFSTTSITARGRCQSLLARLGSVRSCGGSH